MPADLCRVPFGGEQESSKGYWITTGTVQIPQKEAELTLKPLSDTLRPIIDPRSTRTAHPGRP
jgi:hypothetical protein